MFHERMMGWRGCSEPTAANAAGGRSCRRSIRRRRCVGTVRVDRGHFPMDTTAAARDVVALKKSQIVDVERVIVVLEVEIELQTAARVVHQIGERTPTLAGAVFVGIQDLTV